MRNRHCTELYWQIRFQGPNTVTSDTGTYCTAYSEDVADRPDPRGEGEVYQNWKMNNDCIAREPIQNGETDS